MTMKQKPVNEPGALHFPPHLTGTGRPVELDKDEVQVAFDYLSRGKGFITKADIESVIKSIKPDVWSLYSDLIEEGEQVSLDALMKQMTSFEAGSFNAMRESFNLFRGKRSTALQRLMEGKTVSDKKKTDKQQPLQSAVQSNNKDKTSKRGVQDEGSDDEDDYDEQEDEQNIVDEADKDGINNQGSSPRKDQNQLQNATKRKIREKDIITTEDLVNIIRRVNPEGTLNDEDIEYLSHAPDLDGDGIFSYWDFCNLFQHFKDNGLPYGSPVLPSEVDLIVGVPPNQPPLSHIGRKPTEDGQLGETDSQRGMRMQLAELQKRRIWEEQERIKKAKEDEEERERAEKRAKLGLPPEGDEVPKVEEEEQLDPRYADIPELFEKKIFEKQKQQKKSKQPLSDQRKTQQDQKADKKDDEDDIDFT
ncbi:MAG: hypothetical protein EZS28_016028 [Streblomastix strix]|uniref:Uncharacterized protein n=1 Tax=Streblomastix strix TaxID=222440 RepID=A0A5J4W0U1_9EUKA|nr:MAG: hypothetical protein EZS28_016028 [Streblomastix strix]